LPLLAHGNSHSTKNDTIVFNTDCKISSSVDGVDNDNKNTKNNKNTISNEDTTIELAQPVVEERHDVRADHGMNSASAASTRNTPQNHRQKNTHSSAAGSSSAGSSAGKTARGASSGSDHAGKSKTPVHRQHSQQHSTPHRSCSKGSKGSKSGHTPRGASALSSTRSKHQIHVNGISYSKLSLLGRGGSCKVFKVLAPDQKRVLALKRIKLTRTDRKTIAMFENEIELMQRLRGRKNIIQLVDYEINISKKIIYMIMEAGDLDLAHTLEAKKKNGAHLDADFLRVTWRQVSLTAFFSWFLSIFYCGKIVEL
jgi:hypothetical protein